MMNFAPESVYRDSSFVIATICLSINALMISAANLVGADLNEGTSGNASRATPTILNLVLSQVTVTQSLASFLKVTGASGSNRAISKSFLACTQIEPAVETS